jgi:hypothetical protein
MKAILVPPLEVPCVWIEVAPLITKALAHSTEELTADEMLRPIINGECFLWIVVDENESIESVCFGQFAEYPVKKSFFIHGWSTKSGYNFNEVMETFNDSVVNFAKINGCDFIEAKIRKGLTKKLKQLNWNDTHSYVTLIL